MPKTTRDENDLMYLLCKHMSEAYAKVTEIPRGNSLRPDIDILEIRRDQKPPLVLGYEVKLLRYNKKYKAIGLTEFYKGVGQVHCYFQHGVDRAWLVFGLEGAPDVAANKTMERIQSICESFKTTFTAYIRYLGIHFLRWDGVGIILLDARENYPVGSYEYPRYKKESILKKQFKWSKNWLETMKKKELSERIRELEEAAQDGLARRRRA